VTEFSRLRDKYFDADEEWVEDDAFLRKIGRTRQSIGHRCEGCGEKSVVLEEVAVQDASARGGVVWRWRFVGLIAGSVWRDPDLPEPTFRRLDERDRTSFVVLDADGGALLRSLARGEV
jgi:hypothetical protein